LQKDIGFVVQVIRLDMLIQAPNLPDFDGTATKNVVLNNIQPG